jgi:hypothetical protein
MQGTGVRNLLIALILTLWACLAIDITLLCANAYEVRPGSDQDRILTKSTGDFTIHYTDNTVVTSTWGTNG